MKVNLTIDNPDCLNGFLNLDPIVRESGTSKVKADILNLDEHLDAAECSVLKADRVLTYYDSNRVNGMLDNWISKIRKNGIIEIIDIDFESVYKAYIRGEINITRLNSLLYGEQACGWDLRKCCLNLESVCNALKGKGLEIVEKAFNNFNFIVKAKRTK